MKEVELTGLWLGSYVAMWVLVLIMAIVMVSVLRNLGVIYDAMKMAMPQVGKLTPDLEVGQVLPNATFRTLAGDVLGHRDLAGVKQALVIVSPQCGPCVRQLRRMAGQPPDPLDGSVARRVIVSMGDAAATVRLLSEAGVTDGTLTLVDTERFASRAWGVTATPVTIVVDEELRVVRHIVSAAPDNRSAAVGSTANGSSSMSEIAWSAKDGK